MKTSASVVSFLWLACILLFSGASMVEAETLPSFNLEHCAGEAEVIVQGKLDAQSKLEVTKVIGGPTDFPKSVEIVGGETRYTDLQRQIGGNGPYEVVAFFAAGVDEKWYTVSGDAGIVGLNQDAVLRVQDQWHFADSSSQPAYTKTSFLQALDAVVTINQERERLAAQPRSLQRTQDLVGFVLQHCEPTSSGIRARRNPTNYQLGRVASAFKDLYHQEQEGILQALREAKSADEQAILLNLAGAIPLKNEGVETLNAFGVFLPRNHPANVRVAAMDALRAIDSYKVVEYLVPYLVADDPQLATALND